MIWGYSVLALGNIKWQGFQCNNQQKYKQISSFFRELFSHLNHGILGCRTTYLEEDNIVVIYCLSASEIWPDRGRLMKKKIIGPIGR